MALQNHVLLIPACLGFLLLATSAEVRDISQDVPSDQVRCWTTQGRFTVDIYKSWAPKSAKQFLKLVKTRYYDDQVVFRKIPGLLLAQFGQHFKRTTRQKAQEKQIQDDNMGVRFNKGMLSFASGRNTVLFIADAGDGAQSLGGQIWERPFGIVTEGLEDVVSKFYEYPEGSFQNNYSDGAERFIWDGHSEVRGHFPHLDVIVSCHTSKSKKYDDESHPEAVQKAIALRQQLIDGSDLDPEMQLWYHSPSETTLPQKYINVCEECKAKNEAFCVSMLACSKEENMCMSPSDGIGEKKKCTRAQLFKSWPAKFTFPQREKTPNLEL